MVGYSAFSTLICCEKEVRKRNFLQIERHPSTREKVLHFVKNLTFKSILIILWRIYRIRFLSFVAYRFQVAGYRDEKEYKQLKNLKNDEKVKFLLKLMVFIVKYWWRSQDLCFQIKCTVHIHGDTLLFAVR